VTPARVDGLHGAEVVALAAGKFHSAALARDGTLFTWGFGRGGRLGAAAPPVFRVRVQVAPQLWLVPGEQVWLRAPGRSRARQLAWAAGCLPASSGRCRCTCHRHAAAVTRRVAPGRDRSRLRPTRGAGGMQFTGGAPGAAPQATQSSTSTAARAR